MKMYVTIDDAICRLKNGETVYAQEGSRVLTHTSYNHWRAKGMSSNRHYIEVDPNEPVLEKLEVLEEKINQLANLDELEDYAQLRREFKQHISRLIKGKKIMDETPVVLKAALVERLLHDSFPLLHFKIER